MPGISIAGQWPKANIPEVCAAYWPQRPSAPYRLLRAAVGQCYPGSPSTCSAWAPPAAGSTQNSRDRQGGEASHRSGVLTVAAPDGRQDGEQPAGKRQVKNLASTEFPSLDHAAASEPRRIVSFFPESPLASGSGDLWFRRNVRAA